jgi:hypothetical protein
MVSAYVSNIATTHGCTPGAVVNVVSLLLQDGVSVLELRKLFRTILVLNDRPQKVGANLQCSSFTRVLPDGKLRLTRT